jgi:hypothetical protein
MKKSFYLACLTLLVVSVGATLYVRAQDKPAARYEYAILKWDGPDRLFYNLPYKFEIVHLSKTGVIVPRDAQEEEYCLVAGCNRLAKDGWEAVNLNSRRVLLRRLVRQ